MTLRQKRILALRLAAITIVSGIGISGLMGPRPNSAEAFSSGPPAGYTNAPGEDNCTECHFSFPVNTGKGSVSITGVPHDYLPGQQVQVHVTTSDPQALTFGFQVTAIDQTGSTVGTFSVPSVPVPKTQLLKATIGSGERQYVEQTTNGLFNPSTPGSNSWDFTWTTPLRRAGKITFYAAGNASDSNGTPSGDQIYTTAKPTLSGSATSNFDGDFTSDVAYFRPSTAVWQSYNIQTGISQTFTFGVGTDRIVPGDYDGDGRTDLALFRPATAEWRIQRSTLGFVLVPWGAAGDLPVAGDYDGDGKTDQAVFRPSTGAWLVNGSATGSTTLSLGQLGDKPVPGDYDGDARTDIGVYRPSTGGWIVNLSGGGSFSSSLGPGTSEDKPVQGDYDGDGRTDIALFTPSNATWRIRNSSGAVVSLAFGSFADLLAPADYDGDGKTDIAVFSGRQKRFGGVWHIRKSSDGTTIDLTFGAARDVPVASGYLAQ